MNWINIVEVLVTSVSSIVVALVGAGFFKRYNDRKYKLQSKSLLMEQIKKDEIVHLAIRDVRRRYHADRIYIWQFHNGGTFYTTSPMQKLSITYERCSQGLERKSDKNQNHLITNFTNYIKDVMDMKMFFTDISKMYDIGLRSLAQSNGTKSHCAVPIYDREKSKIKFSRLSFKSLLKKEKFLQQKMCSQKYSRFLKFKVNFIKILR